MPSSQAPAVALAAKYQVTGTLPRPFYSPLVVVAHRSAAEVLAANGLAALDTEHRGTFEMAAHLDAARADRTWHPGNPLVVVYESQVASLPAEGQQPDDLVVLHPDTTVNSDHTVVPLTDDSSAC